MGFYFSAHSVSRGIRGLYLAARRVERLAIPVGEKLVVHVPALHGTDRVCLYWLARLHAALADARDVHVCGNGAAVVKPVGAGVHARGDCGVVLSSVLGRVEFFFQSGPAGTAPAAP